MEVVQGLVVGVWVLVHQDCASAQALQYLESAACKSLSLYVRGIGVEFLSSAIYQEVLSVVAQP